MSSVKRRDFLVGGALTGFGVACGHPFDEAAPPPAPASEEPGRIDEGSPKPLPPPANPANDPGAVPTRPFGKTGSTVTQLGLGGTHGVAEEKELALAIIERAYAKGIRFFDSAHIYAACEWHLGEALEKKRSSVFLQTKTMVRDYDGAMRDLETSLQALRTDYIDAWLMHDMRHQAEVDQVLAKGGALEALQKAKAQGVVRSIGVSGHSYPLIIKAMLDTRALDCVTMAINAADSFEKPFVPTALQAAIEQNLGIVTMKTMGGRNILSALTPKEAMGWSLSHPISVALVAIEKVSEIDENVEIARSFEKLAPEALQLIEEKAATVAYPATFFRRGGHA
jgi:aryl-alcohol dehydrogenase-like predicted oxidoreductase